jgi:hypothetical protein
MAPRSGAEKYKEFICGWSAGCIETFLLFPQNKLIFRQTVQNIILADAIKQVYKN